MQRRILASVSGGKDSGAMALWLLEQGLEIEAVFLDTGWEHPATYDYLRSTLAGAIGEITWLRPERSMSELVLHKSMFPSRARRFCTADLKLAPFEAHIASYPPGTVVNVIGVRADESRARAGLPRWSCEDGNRVFVDTWRPLIAWREDDVFAIHARHGLSLNPLYAHGAARVGCWPCIYARRAEIRRLAEIDPGRIEHIRQLERDVGSTFFYDRGGRGATCIDEVVAWARAGAGAGDESDERFDPGEGNRGCMRWGLCDLATPEAPDHDERVQAQRARAPHAGGAPPAGDDALAWAARGYRLQLEGHAERAHASYRAALSRVGRADDPALAARVHANLALLCGDDDEAASAHAAAAEACLAEAALAGEAAAAIYAVLAADALERGHDLPRALERSGRALALGQPRQRPARRALRIAIARALGDDAVADLEGRRGLQENPWHPALRRQLELCGLCASSVTPPARRDGALSPVGLEPIGY